MVLRVFVPHVGRDSTKLVGVSKCFMYAHTISGIRIVEILRILASDDERDRPRPSRADY